MTPEESYQFSLIEARCAKLEAENQRLREYEDFDKTYAGSVCDLLKEVVPAMNVMLEVLQAFRPGDMEALSKIARYWEKHRVGCGYSDEDNEEALKEWMVLERLKAAAERLES